MGLPSGGSKQFQPTPPERGSFPLDHEGECKEPMRLFMQCLAQNNHNGRACRVQAKAYLDCRMERGLMAKEDWTNLGLPANEQLPKQ
eukprot:m.45659 g.45659  ORF g.45659 m.45659 type:complete len:87 (+) comp14689_c0_seq2:76-336(+)